MPASVYQGLPRTSAFPFSPEKTADQEYDGGKIEPLPGLSGGPQQEETPPKASPVDPTEDPRMMSLFKKATGTSFDPNSKRDIQALSEIQTVLNDISEKGDNWADMSDTQLALKWYQSKHYGSQTGRKP